MARLPIPGSDQGTWGDVLNDFLSQAHASDGTIKTGSISESQLTPAVQTKLNSGPGAVTSVNGQQGAVVLDKTDVGLGNVDNTSDVSKPISTAVQTALDTKADAADVGAKVLLIDTVGDLPPGTPADVIVVVKS